MGLAIRTSKFVSLVAADFGMAFLWVFLNAILRVSIDLVARYVGIYGTASQMLKRSMVVALLFFFYWLGKATGGASYNPVTVIAFVAAKITDVPLFVLAFRLPAQVVGAVGGALTAVECIPDLYKPFISGPYLRVDPHTGALAEGILTFLCVLIILVTNLKGPKSGIQRTWITSICRVSLSIFGAEYTGPALNPANAFGWAFLKNQHSSWEHLYVYWLSPILASVAAAWAVSSVLALEQTKEKKS